MSMQPDVDRMSDPTFCRWRLENELGTQNQAQVQKEKPGRLPCKVALPVRRLAALSVLWLIMFQTAQAQTATTLYKLTPSPYPVIPNDGAIVPLEGRGVLSEIPPDRISPKTSAFSPSG